MHNHHIIPRYEGGSDDPSNIVLLTVTQHAMWHYAEWTRKHNLQDKLAWQGLSRIVGQEELVAELSKLTKRFTGKTHKEESKRKNSESHRKKFEEDSEYRERKINNAIKMGEGGHKRNPGPGTESMSGPNKRQYMRRHWRKEVWDDLEKTYRNRTGFRWGKIDLSKRHGVSLKTLDNMLLLIIEGVDWDTATNWGQEL